LLVVFLFSAYACSGSSGGGDGAAEEPDGALGDGSEESADSSGDDAGLNADLPGPDGGDVPGGDQREGIGCFLTISVIEMMGQKTALAAGGFYPEVNLVPWDPEKGLHGFVPDTCRALAAAAAECQTDADCQPPGRVCVIEKDQSGNPDPNSGHCENPTGDPVDIGPVTISGFADGPKTLRYNSSQQGAYTIDGQGDGQVDPALIVFDRDYEISGEGSSAYNLGAFSGRLHLPPQLALLEPPAQTNQMGMPEIVLDTKSDTVFRWMGSSNGYVRLTINGKDSGIECLARDDGEFTVTAADMAGLVLNQFSFFNILTIERNSYGSLSGPGLVNPQVSSMMNVMVNVKSK